MKPAVLLFCVSLLFGQSNSPAPESKAQPPAGSAASPIQQAAVLDRRSEAVDILSDTQGVDFNAYLQRIVGTVRESWYHLIPESVEHKKGKLAIEFAIEKDGKVANMHLAATSGDMAMDRPAWVSIAGSNPFPALPKEFTGPYLALCIHFYYNPDKSDFATQNYGFEVGALAGKYSGSVDVLSDSQEVDFGPYLKDVLVEVKSNWSRLIPKSAAKKKGKLTIDFSITKEGKVADMWLAAATGDMMLDRPAWGSITTSNPFKPLPEKFTGKYVRLRIRFYYNSDKDDTKAGSN